MKISKYLLLATFILTFSSCATILNTKKTNVRIITSEPAKIVVNHDTDNYSTTRRIISISRSKQPLLLTVYTDSVSSSVKIRSRNSLAYWLNFYPALHLWTGFWIDTKTKKRYTYPKTIYIDLSCSDSSYLTYVPLSTPYNTRRHIVKLTPLKLIGIVNPAIEVSYERKTSDRFSMQFTAAYLLPAGLMDKGAAVKPNIKGFRLALEEKMYFRKSALAGLYMGFELSYFQNRYYDIWTFGEKYGYSSTHGYNNYLDTFGIKKQVVGFAFKIGRQFIIKDFAIDIYTGLALRYKHTTHFNRINPADEMEIPRHPNISYSTNLDGEYWTVGIPLNIRIGFAF